MKNTLETSISKAKLKEKSRRTREQVINATREENSLIWDRHSPRYKIKKQRQQSSEYLSDRKLIIFLSQFCIPPVSQKQVSCFNIIYTSESLLSAQKITRVFETTTGESMLALRRVFSPKIARGYIESYPKAPKREGRSEESSYQQVWPEPRSLVTVGDKAFDNVMSEAEWLEFVEMFGKRDAIELLESGLVTVNDTVKRKSMFSDEDSQPKFNVQPERQRSNVSAYQKWEPEKREAENIEDAFARMAPFINSPDWDRFVYLMGKEEAMKWFEAGLKQATREDE